MAAFQIAQEVIDKVAAAAVGSASSTWSSHSVAEQVSIQSDPRMISMSPIFFEH
jgi:hypothetical protein